MLSIAASTPTVVMILLMAVSLDRPAARDAHGPRFGASGMRASAAGRDRTHHRRSCAGRRGPARSSLAAEWRDDAGDAPLPEPVLALESAIRLGTFGGVFAAMAAWELWAPRRPQAIGRARRWPGNLGIVVLDALLVRLVFPIASVGVALVAESRGWGLFHALAVPSWVAAVASILLLDLALYLQHVLFHAVPALWRLHRMHHADLEFDATTGVRFHPIEILLSTVIKLGVVVALGAPPVAVLIFDVLLNATSMFNHGNVRIPERIEQMLRWIVVTPEMHRVHHSILAQETNSNFGFNAPWWDHLLGTYRAAPAAGHEGMTIGIAQFRDPSDLRLDRMLLQPFRDSVGPYPLGQRERGQ
jgi:sterol desaturase/sphingolipid hydroxylase (fatty acid hydroxylase superfamily)